jgi:hypothetical protein
VGRRIICAIVFCCLAHAQAIRPESLLADLHTQSREQPPHDRLMLLWELAIAATGVDAATSAAWAIEMYDVAAHAPHYLRWQQMNQAAGRKNALTILSLTDPKRAAEHFLELEPSPAHQPSEDPRIDLARHLFPRLWTVEGRSSLPELLRFADFTSRTGQYPYVAMGHVLPKLAKVDPAAAHSVMLSAIDRLGKERGIRRTQDDYLKFLRESWPAVSAKDRRLAVEAALSVAGRSGGFPAGTTVWAEYYLPEGTVRLDSEENARVYDLLPFVDKLDANWGRQLRRQHPALANLPVPQVDRAPWRSGVIAAPGPNLEARVDAAFERHHLVFLARWSEEDAKRAAALAQATKDPARRRQAIALVLPAYAKVDRAQAEGWARELMAGPHDDLDLMAPLARAWFVLGHPDEAMELVDAAIKVGEQLWAKRDPAQPVYAVNGVASLRDLADTYGEFRGDDLKSFVSRVEHLDPPLVIYLVAGAVRGALRHRPGYQEPD